MKKIFLILIFGLVLTSGFIFSKNITHGACVVESEKYANGNIIDSNNDGKITQYCLLEPLPLGNDGAFSEITNETDLGEYLGIIFKVILGIIGVLAVVMIIVGGVQYMTTDALGGKENGKETVTNAVAGLILALSSWLILNTINPDLVSFKLNIKEVGVKGVSPDAPPQITTVTIGDQQFQTSCKQSPIIDGQQITPGSVWATGMGEDQSERTNLKNANIAINANNCPIVGSKKCTSVANLPVATIAKLKEVKQKCDTFNGGAGKCDLVITGGTECWLHSSHGPDLNRVDLRATDSLNKYITGSKTFPNDGADHEKDGIKYLAETDGQHDTTTGAHWHINEMK